MALVLRTVKGSPLTWAEGDQNLQYLYSGSLYTTGVIGVSGSIIPAVVNSSRTSSYSLGSATNAWKDLWISNGTINFINGAGVTQGTLSATADGLNVNALIVSGAMKVTGSIGVTGSIEIQQGTGVATITGADYVSANVLAPSRNYKGVYFQSTASIAPVISDTVWTTNYTYIQGGLGSYFVTTDFGIGYEYNPKTGGGRFAPAIKMFYNPNISQATGSFGQYYLAGYSTIISNNRNLDNNANMPNVAIDEWGNNNALTVTGSFYSRDNTTLGRNTNSSQYLVGTTYVTGSLEVTGRFNLDPQTRPNVGLEVPGQIYFSSQDSHFYGWNGSAWKQLDN